MPSYNKIADVTKKLSSTILRGQARAINKAVSKTRTEISKELRADTGLKTKPINARLLVLKATIKKLEGSVNLATKVGVSIGEFSPRSQKVDVSGKTYYGVTAKILGSREFISGGFLRNVGKAGKEIVMARKDTILAGAYNNIKGHKYPTALLRTGVLRDIMLAKADSFKRLLTKEYERLVSHEVEYSIEQYINK